MRTQRIENIRAYILERKTVSLEDICAAFDISMSTLRRDLEEVLQGTNIKKIYGGVTVRPNHQVPAFQVRNVVNPAGKRAIAARAAQMIDENDVVFLDSGTTTLYLLDAIGAQKHVSVLTSHLEIMYRAAQMPNIELIALPGTFNRKTHSFMGSGAAEMLARYNISKAFLATSGISASNGVTNSSPVEAEIKSAAVRRSLQKILLTDHSKFDMVALMTYCALGDLDVLVTDGAPPAGLADALATAQVETVLACPRGEADGTLQ